MKDVAQAQQQRPELPMVTLTWHAHKYKVHKLHSRECPSGGVYLPSIYMLAG